MGYHRIPWDMIEYRGIRYDTEDTMGFDRIP